MIIQPEQALRILEHEPSGPRTGNIADVLWKVHGGCNIACKYCYVYELQDRTWESQKGAMADDVIMYAAQRMGGYAAEHNIPGMRAVLHGGEPLLRKPEFFRNLAHIARAAMPETTTLDINVQTNATLLDENYLRTFVDGDISFGLSLDGNREANDRFRLYRNGQSSYPKVVAALELVDSQEDYRRLFAGILCYIQPDIDPIETYESLAKFKPPSLDFMFPLYDRTHRPPGYPTEGNNGTPYADWLIKIFDVWSQQQLNYIQQPDEYSQPPSIPIFREIIYRLFGQPSRAVILGQPGKYFPTICIDTDGSYELPDPLRSNQDGLIRTGLSVKKHSMTQAETYIALRCEQLGLLALPAGCELCVEKNICAGGRYSDRYEENQDLLYVGTSVYCDDLRKLIKHIKRRSSIGFANMPLEEFERPYYSPPPSHHMDTGGNSPRALAQLRAQRGARELLKGATAGDIADLVSRQ
jgi:uncharacterized protein